MKASNGLLFGCVDTLPSIAEIDTPAKTEVFKCCLGSAAFKWLQIAAHPAPRESGSMDGASTPYASDFKNLGRCRDQLVRQIVMANAGAGAIDKAKPCAAALGPGPFRQRRSGARGLTKPLDHRGCEGIEAGSAHCRHLVPCQRRRRRREKTGVQKCERNAGTYRSNHAPISSHGWCNDGAAV